MAELKPFLMPAGQGKRLHLLGQGHLYRVTGEQSGGALLLLEQSEPAGAGIPPHIHEREDETFYILQGAVEFDVDGSLSVAKAGDVAGRLARGQDARRQRPRQDEDEQKLSNKPRQPASAASRRKVRLCPRRLDVGRVDSQRRRRVLQRILLAGRSLFRSHGQDHLLRITEARMGQQWLRGQRPQEAAAAVRAPAWRTTPARRPGLRGSAA